MEVDRQGRVEVGNSLAEGKERRVQRLRVHFASSGEGVDGIGDLAEECEDAAQPREWVNERLAVRRRYRARRREIDLADMTIELANSSTSLNNPTSICMSGMEVGRPVPHETMRSSAKQPQKMRERRARTSSSSSPGAKGWKRRYQPIILPTFCKVSYFMKA